MQLSSVSLAIQIPQNEAVGKNRKLTSKSVKVVSVALGYQDQFYLSRLFKKKVGVPPDVYRKTVGFAKFEKTNV